MAIHVDVLLELHRRRLKRDMKETLGDLDAMGKQAAQDFADSFQSAEPKIRKSLNKVMDSTVNVVQKTKELEAAEKSRNAVAEKSVKINKELGRTKERLNYLTHDEEKLTDASTMAAKRNSEALEVQAKRQRQLTALRDRDKVAIKKQSDELNEWRSIHNGTTEAVRLMKLENKQMRLNGKSISKQRKQRLIDLEKEASDEQKIIADLNRSIEAMRSNSAIRIAAAERRLTEAKEAASQASSDLNDVERQTSETRKDVKKLTEEITAAEKELVNVKNESAKADEEYLRRADAMDKATRDRIETLKTMREELIKQRDAENENSLANRFRRRSRGSGRRTLDSVGSVMTEIPGVPGGPAGAAIGLGVVAMMGNVAKAVVTATQALWLLPAAGAAGGAAIGTLAIATHGFFDTLGDMGDAEKFAEGLAKLAPNAQQTALAIKALVDGPLGELKDATQNTFFEGVPEQIWNLTETFYAPFKDMTTGIAQSFNDTFMGITNQLMSPETVEQMRNIFSNVGSFFEKLEPVGASLTAAFTQLTSVGSDFLPGLAESIAGVAEDFRMFIQENAADGDLRRWIEDGIAAVKELGGAIWEIGQHIYDTFAVDNVEEFKQGMKDAVGIVKLVLDGISTLSSVLNDHGEIIAGVIAIWATWKTATIITDLGSIAAGLLGLSGAAKTGAAGVTTAFSGLTSGGGAVATLLAMLTKAAKLAGTLGLTTLAGNSIANQLEPGLDPTPDAGTGDRPWWWGPAMGLTQIPAWMGFNPWGLRDDENKAPSDPDYTGGGSFAAPSGPSIFGGVVNPNTLVGPGTAPGTDDPNFPSFPGQFDVPAPPGDELSESEKKKAWFAQQDISAYMPDLGFSPMPQAYTGSTFPWDAVAQAESSGRWDDNNSGGHSTSSGAPRGGLQITDGTWASYGGQEFAPTANLATKDEQIAVAERIAFTGYNGTAPQGLGAWEAITNGSVPGVTAGSAPGVPTAGFTPGGGYGGANNVTGLGQGQTSQGIEALAQNIGQMFPGVNLGGWRPSDGPNTPTGHQRGVALDIGIGEVTPQNQAIGDQINAYIRQNAAAFGVKSTIWRDQWKDFEGNQSTVGGHQNHVHVEVEPQGGTGQPPIVWGNNGDPYAQNAYGYYDVDPRAIRDAQARVTREGRDVALARMEEAYLQQNGGDAFELEEARWKTLEEEEQLRQAQEDLAEKTQGTFKKLSNSANGMSDGMQQIGAKLDSDFGISKGLPGIFENLFKLIANAFAAPVLGALTGVTQAAGTAGPGTGLLGALAPAQGLLGARPGIFGALPNGNQQAAPTGPFGIPQPYAGGPMSTAPGGYPGPAPTPYASSPPVGSPTSPGLGNFGTGPSLAAPAPASTGWFPGLSPHHPAEAIPAQRGNGFPTPLVPGAPALTLNTGSAYTESRGIAPGQGMPASDGIGLGGGLIGAAAGMGGSMLGPMGAGAQIGIDLINRGIGAGAQLTGNAVQGVMDTFLPVESELADPSRGWFGRILGAVAGVAPAATNLAGGLTEKLKAENGESPPPLSPQQASAEQARRGEGAPGGGNNVTNNIQMVERENRNDYSVARDIGYQAAKATGG